jgi:hypothetical protein
MHIARPLHTGSTAQQSHTDGMQRATDKLIGVLQSRAAYADDWEFQAIRDLIPNLRSLPAILQLSAVAGPRGWGEASLRAYLGGTERRVARLIDVLAHRAAYASDAEFLEIRDVITHLRPLAAITGPAGGTRPFGKRTASFA